VSRLSTQELRTLLAASVIPVSDQDEREALFFAVLANPELLDAPSEAA